MDNAITARFALLQSVIAGEQSPKVLESVSILAVDSRTLECQEIPRSKVRAFEQHGYKTVDILADWLEIQNKRAGHYDRVLYRNSLC